MEIIIGVVVSLLVQAIKKFWKTNTAGTLISVLALSVIGAIGYSLLISSGIWESILPVLAISGAFYTYIIARFEK